MIIDSHAHIEKEFYDNIEEVVAKSKDMGIDIIITAGTDAKTNIEAMENAHDYENIYACVGIHPEFANIYKKADVDILEEYLKDPKVIAIGEIGLDYHYDGYDKRRQIELLESQLVLAEKLNMPVVIHSREATEDTINTLKKYKVKGVIHSFSGSKETAEIYLKMGYKLGINGVVTFKNAHLKEVVKSLGIEHFLLETDSPFLAPEPFRGKQNIPGNIKYIVDFLEEYLEVPKAVIMEATRKSTYQIFDKLPR